MGNSKIEFFACFLLILCMGILIAILIDEGRKKKKKHKKRLRLNIHFHHKNNHCMSTTSLVLTDKVAHVGVLSVSLGDGGPVIPGTISNITEAVSDPLQDSANADAANPNAVDITAITDTGNSVVSVTADFASTETVTGPDGTTQVPKYSATGLTISVAVTNNIATPPPPQPVLNINF